MTAATVLNSLAAYLKPLIQNAGGTLEPSGTLEDTLAKLAIAPNGWRCVLQWNGEKDLGISRNVTELSILAIIQQPRGLTIDAGLSVSTGTGTQPSLLDRVEFVCDLVRGATFVHDQLQRRFTGRGRKWLQDPLFPTRQIMCEFAMEMGRSATVCQQVTLLSSEQLGLGDGSPFGLHDGTVLGGHV
jgi:hypothetical protein